MSLRFHEDDTRPLGRGTAGVMGIRPDESDFVIGLALVTESCTLLVASENGIGKRTTFEDYRRQSRGGKGIITMKVTDKTGPVVGAVTVTEADELMLMTSSGQSIRIRAAEVRETGRNAQGVKLLTLKDGEKLQDVSIVIPDGEDGAPASGGESENSDPDTQETPEDGLAG
jgi:DNA gyrase subunit A